MEFWAALLGALVGAVGGGAATYVAAVHLWKRDRRTVTMENFYSQAYRFIDHVHPMGSQRSTVAPEDLYHSEALLSLYAPSSVSSAAGVITGRVFDLVEGGYPPNADFDDDQKLYDELRGLLGSYESAMRRALGLGTKASQ